MQENFQVASTVKHFAGHSNNKGGREGQARTDPQTSPREVENIFLPPFAAAIKEGGALYPFGHGLSYTTFAYSNLKVTPARQTPGGSITVRFDLKNTGAREGDEVAQLYTRDPVSSVTTYGKNLRGFERVHLKPGETRNVAFTLKPEDFALWDRSMRFVVEPGAFRVMVGSSSEDIRLTGEFHIVPAAGRD